MNAAFREKKLAWRAAAAVLLLALLQLTNPARINPPVKTDFLTATAPPPPVAALFRAACYDCHSNQTRWPWYSRTAPVSWQIASDVNDGRAQLNFSDWPVGNPKRAWKKMEDMSEEISQREMPLKKYAWIHADARLSENQRAELAQWLDAQVERLKESVTKAN